jgi:hypothetical protein
MQPLKQLVLACALAAGFAGAAQADAVTDWNTRAGQFVLDAKMGTPPAVRLMAVVQTAVHEAVSSLPRQGADATAVDAAVAAANRATLVKLLPAQEAAIQAAYQAAVGTLPEGPAKANGLATGERAALAVLAARADDGAGTPERYRPTTAAGVYVPTAAPAVPQWSQRKPWLLARADQFRPAPPPALDSALWTRDYNEVKALGSRASTARSAEQTAIAKFWEFSLPSIYFGVVRSVAAEPGRDALRNARLYAASAQAMDDALIAVMDAKYHYHFWRPATAIRNGDTDNNAATERDAGWVAFSDNPLHPEYPSAHSILAGAVGTLLQAELAGAAVPTLSTTSPSANGATRRWSRIEDFVAEVGNARIYEGIHFRNSTEIGLAMGRQIGQLAAARHFAAAPAEGAQQAQAAR